MRKTMLIVLSICIGFAAFAQQSYQFKIDTKEQKRIETPAMGIEPVQSTSIAKSQTEKAIFTPPVDRDVNIVTIENIGTMANLWSFANGARSMLYVAPEMNTVALLHRMGGSLDPGGYSGDLGYDISTDGGMTWSNQNEIYVADDNGGGEYFVDAARYPNMVISDPVGDANADDAYITFFAPILDESNGTWGGYAYGVGNVGDTSIHTKNRLASHDEYYQYIPDDMALTSTGETWTVDPNQDWTSGSIVYLDQLILNRGTWNGSDFEYTQSLLDAEMTVDAGRPAMTKIAFGPDGMTGYIVALGDNGEAEQLGGNFNYYPIYWKTTDGGDNWEGPNFIQMDGTNGIGGIVYHHITDEQIAELFEAPVPAREEISYTTSFDFDLVVDANDNLHLGVMIGPTGSDPHSIVTAEGFLGAVDMFTRNGGETWEVEEMGRARTFRGTWGDVVEDNRIQITTNPARDMMFVSWLDTDLEDETDNQRPNIWARGFDINTYMKTMNSAGEDAPTNVTLFSEGMWQAYLAVAPAFCFENGDSYNIPFVYVEMDPNDDLVPVQLKYIKDFSFSMADFTVQGVEDNVVDNSIAEVSQNFPNPFSGESFVTVTLSEGSDLNMNVFTLTGQKVSSRAYGYMSSGAHTLTIAANELSSGVYFYTITAGESKVTRKMIVE